MTGVTQKDAYCSTQSITQPQILNSLLCVNPPPPQYLRKQLFQSQRCMNEKNAISHDAYPFLCLLTNKAHTDSDTKLCCSTSLLSVGTQYRNRSKRMTEVGKWGDGAAFSRSALFLGETIQVRVSSTEQAIIFKILIIQPRNILEVKMPAQVHSAS
jgi:hypothetical protein